MTRVEFDLYAQQGYNRIPVAREILADLDTPLSTYLKLADTGYSYLFESVHGGEKWGRYSIIGLPCETIIRVTGQQIVTSHRGKVIDHSTVRCQWHDQVSATGIGNQTGADIFLQFQ